MNDAEQVDVGELHEDTSRYLAMAKAGKRVTVIEQGEPVAYLVPAEEGGTTFARMKAAGQVRPAVGNLLDLMPPPPTPPGQKTLTETLLEMRDEEDY